MEQPLALKMRPQNLSQVLGQKHLINENSFLVNSLKLKKYFSIIFFGPSGTGKTTLAEAYAREANAHIVSLNAAICGKKEIESAIEEAKIFKPTFIIIDEIHRLNKDKQDILLPYLETGLFYLIGATTANPYIAINKAIRSRCYLLEVKSLSINDIETGIRRAIESKNGLNNSITLSNEQISYLASISGGDLRYAYNLLEILSVTFINKNEITIEDLKDTFKGNYLLDKNDDDHYDLESALQKSIRGSDVDAALFYLAKLCVAEDLATIKRRLTVIAYEDVGFGNPPAVDRTINALASAELVGFPEAAIALGFAVCDLALSPKSRTTSNSIEEAIAFAKQNSIPVQDYLRFKPVGKSELEKYPYDRPDVWPKLQYLPDAISHMKFYKKHGLSKYDEAMFQSYLNNDGSHRTNDLKKLKSKKYEL